MNLVIGTRRSIHDVNNNASLIIYNRICPFCRIHNSKVLINQLLVIQLLHKFKRFQIGVSHMIGNELTIYIAPFVRSAEP
ncbi:hypothetical protein D3C78_1563930 [compost metagenome]